MNQKYDDQGIPIYEEEKHDHQCRGLWIPIEVIQKFEDGELSSTDVLLLAIIDSLVKAKGIGCWASNKHLAKRLHKTPIYISEQISKLRKRGLLKFVGWITRKNGRYRILETPWSRILKTLEGGKEKTLGRGKEKTLEGGKEKTLGPNTTLQGKTREKVSKNGGEYTNRRKEKKNTLLIPARFASPDQAESEYNPSKSEDNTIPLNQSRPSKEVHRSEDNDPGLDQKKINVLPPHTNTGFGHPSIKTKDHRLAKHLYRTLKKQDKIRRKPAWDKWTAAFKEALEHTTYEKLKEFIAEYGKHINDPWMPKAYSGDTFVNKLPYIETALDRINHKEEENSVW